MTVLTYICDLLQSELELADDQVVEYNNKWIVPNDQRMYVVLTIFSCKPFSNYRSEIATTDGMQTQQVTNFQALLQIDAISRSKIALDRKEEILMALNSIAAEQSQLANGYLIGKITTGFVNNSSIDGAAIPYRFTLSLNIQYAVTKTKDIDFYDSFTKEVHTENDVVRDFVPEGD